MCFATAKSDALGTRGAPKKGAKIEPIESVFARQKKGRMAGRPRVELIIVISSAWGGGAGHSHPGDNQPAPHPYLVLRVLILRFFFVKFPKAQVCLGPSFRRCLGQSIYFCVFLPDFPALGTVFWPILYRFSKRFV